MTTCTDTAIREAHLSLGVQGFLLGVSYVGNGVPTWLTLSYSGPRPWVQLITAWLLAPAINHTVAVNCLAWPAAAGVCIYTDNFSGRMF